MTTFDKSASTSLVLNPKTASILSKVYWEIRNQRNELNSSDEDHTLIYFQDLILELESQIDSSLELFFMKIYQIINKTASRSLANRWKFSENIY